MPAIHYTHGPDETVCLMCGKTVNPGLTGEPSTRSITIWQKPPSPFHPCTEETSIDDLDTTG